MVDCVVRDWQGEEVGQATLDLRVAKEESAAHVVHRALVMQMTNGRQGTASTKTRAEVRGGGRKPGDKKDRSSACWLKPFASVAWWWCHFGPKPRDYNLKMNRKERG
jgi:large subunit ribosomal protein L4